MTDEAKKLEPQFDVVTFGETMLRLSAPGFSRLEEAVSLDVRIGGSESNTAVALARLGLRAAWWSKLPANPLGRRIENEIDRKSTRLNSSHGYISYAVFCLKKKKKTP